MAHKRPLVIGIGGGTGAGKTTIAQAITRGLPVGAVVYLQHDSYYRDRPDLTLEERAALNFDHPDSLETELLVRHVDALCAGYGVDQPSYDFKTHRRRPETGRVEPAPVLVVEGILIFADLELVQRLDVKLFVDTPADIRVLRRIRRDIEHRGRSFDDIRVQYYETVRPMHEAFVEPTKYKADFVIPEGGDHRVAIGLIGELVRGRWRDRAAG